MEILLLTVFLSLLLAVLFLMLFLRDRKADHVTCAEQEALRPLESESTVEPNKR